MSDNNFDYAIKCLSKNERIEIEECESTIVRIRMLMTEEEEEWFDTYINEDAIKNLIDRLQSFLKRSK